MFKYDTVHGIYDGTVENDDSNLIVDGQKIKVGGYVDTIAATKEEIGGLMFLMVSGD